MKKQIVVNKQTGERFETTRWLSVADAVRITGYNSLRSAWRPIAGNGGEIEVSPGAIEGFGSYLKPATAVVVAAPAQAQAVARWQDQPATQAQLDYLAKLRVRVELPLTKAQASRMIDAAREGDAALEYEDGPYTGEVY
jgi:hypothetical protein